MSSISADQPPLDSPLDAVDMCITAGGAIGLLLYVTALLLGDVEAATTGVAVGVVCVLGALTLRSVRAAIGA